MVMAIALPLGACGVVGAFDLPAIQAAGHQGDGSYYLTPQEKLLDCQGLQHHATALTNQMASLPARAKAESEATPTTVTSTFSRYLLSGRSGLPAVKEFGQTEVRLRVVRQHADSKGCRLKDLDKPLADARAKMDAFLKS